MDGRMDRQIRRRKREGKIYTGGKRPRPWSSCLHVWWQLKEVNPLIKLHLACSVDPQLLVRIHRHKQGPDVCLKEGTTPHVRNSVYKQCHAQRCVEGNTWEGELATGLLGVSIEEGTGSQQKQKYLSYFFSVHVYTYYKVCIYTIYIYMYYTIWCVYTIYMSYILYYML